MKTNRRSYAHPLALPIALALLGAGCATTTPVELSNARAAYQRVGFREVGRFASVLF